MAAEAVARRPMLGAATSEDDFASLVEGLSPDPADRALLSDLLHEDLDVYAGRGAAATNRMRGWALAAFERVGLLDSSLLWVLEELDNGRDPYLVAAAARALRGCLNPTPALAPFLIRAFDNIRFDDEIVSFAQYGAYPDSGKGTTALQEVVATLAWLGPRARAAVPDLRMLADGDGRGGLSPDVLASVRETIRLIQEDRETEAVPKDECCALSPRWRGILTWRKGSREDSETVEMVQFEDQDGRRVDFAEVFHGKPSIVTFFYTRCSNPRKCSLTVAKMARVQQLLGERGLDRAVRTAAITYDPGWDLPDRLRGYGRNRGFRMDDDHRLLRTVSGLDALRGYFRLGVNFIGSLVNRHRIEAFVVDPEGRIASRFERVQWDEREVVEYAARVLAEGAADAPRRPVVPAAVSAIAAVFAALVPKCAACWGMYLSALGVAGLERMPYLPGFWPLLVVALGVNLGSLWLRGRVERRQLGLYVSATGALTMLALGLWTGLAVARPVGIGLMLVGSVLGVSRAAFLWGPGSVRPHSARRQAQASPP
jgi:protein SCO1